VNRNYLQSVKGVTKDKKAVAGTVLLELSGLRAPTKTQRLSANYTLNKEEVELFKTRGVKAAMDYGVTITAGQAEEALTNDNEYDLQCGS